MPRLHFEDFAPGDRMTYAPVALDQAAIVGFARAWDPQPFHVDPVAARDSFAGSLIASGWHTCALMMRALADGFILEAASMGAPGIEEVRWLAPVRPGAVLVGGHEVLETRASRSRPGMGLVRFRFTMRDESADGRPVLEQTNWILFARRGAEAVPPTIRRAGEGGPPPPPTAARPLPCFEDILIGAPAEVLGARTFGADEIVAFARAFDPQLFHLDEEAARKSHFGGLCASGWHTGAAWMRAMVDHRERCRIAALEAGARPARMGASPGFVGLVWSRPVYAGDTITWTTRAVDKRETRSRPDWGLVFTRNEGVNQHGETVFGFDGRVFWERRGG
jgi:acyl dehydratase